MPRQPNSPSGRISTVHDLKRPTVGGLLGHILSASVSSAALTLLIGGSILIGLLHYHGFPALQYLALLPVMVGALALVRGGRAWQADLDHYQKALASARHGHAQQYRGRHS